MTWEFLALSPSEFTAQWDNAPTDLATPILHLSKILWWPGELHSTSLNFLSNRLLSLLSPQDKAHAESDCRCRLQQGTSMIILLDRNATLTSMCGWLVHDCLRSSNLHISTFNQYAKFSMYVTEIRWRNIKYPSNSQGNLHRVKASWIRFVNCLSSELEKSMW